MTTREEFEAWCNERGYVQLEFVWDGWQASRTAALEEAAKECDLMQASYERSAEGAEFGEHIREWDKADAAEQCALGIRALK